MRWLAPNERSGFIIAGALVLILLAVAVIYVELTVPVTHRV